MARTLQVAWSEATRDGTVWDTERYRRRIRTIEFLSVTVLDVLTRTKEILAGMRKNHPEWTAPAGSDGVAATLQSAQDIASQARKTMEWLNRPRPPVNEEMIRRSRESLERNEGEFISDIIARLEHGGPLVKE